MGITSIAQLILLGSLWGSSYLYIRVAVEGLSPFAVVAARLFFGALLLFAVIRVWGLTFPRVRTMWLHLIVMAIIGNVIPWSLISWASQHIDSGLAAVLNSTTPFFTILFAVAAFGAERLTVPRFIGVVLGFTGVAILTGADVTNLASENMLGKAAVLFASVCYGLAFAYARRFVRGEAIVLAGCQIGLAFLIVSPLALVFGDPLGSDLTPTRVGAILALGLLTSGLAYILYYRLIAEIGATMASYATYLVPVVGLFLGWLILDERFTGQSLIGVVFILTGLAIATALHRDPAPARPETSVQSAASRVTPEPSSRNP